MAQIIVIALVILIVTFTLDELFRRIGWRARERSNIRKNNKLLIYSREPRNEEAIIRRGLNFSVHLKEPKTSEKALR